MSFDTGIETIHTQFRVIMESCLVCIDPYNFIGCVLSYTPLFHNCLSLMYVFLYPLGCVYPQCPLWVGLIVINSFSLLFVIESFSLSFDYD